jgi:hypothetical protein
MFRSLQFALLVWGLSLPAVASSGTGLGAQLPRAFTPRQVAERFDSLMQVGTPEAMAGAKALTVGPARRLFPLMADAQARLAPFLDTAQSRDSVLREDTRSDWAVLEVRALAVFRKPFLGMERFESLQAVHLHRDASGWRLADFEALADGARAVPRSGPLAEDSAATGEAGDAAMLPISRLAPDKGAMRRVTRLRLRVSTRGGDSLFLPANVPGQGAPGQTVLARGASWAEIETRLPVLPANTARKPVSAALRPYLASTSDLDLSDPLLRKQAAALKKGAADDAEIARRIRRHVSENFDYRLGATLFGTSRDVLRDRKGDCSEAAVLVAALLRASGIPSRVTLGYATLGDGVWIGHAWAEGFIGGAWIGVDAALREFPAGASRLALASLSGERVMRTEATNLMIRTLSNLDVAIIGAWAGGEALPLTEHPAAAAEARDFWDKLLKGMGE